MADCTPGVLMGARQPPLTKATNQQAGIPGAAFLPPHPAPRPLLGEPCLQPGLALSVLFAERPGDETLSCASHTLRDIDPRPLQLHLCHRHEPPLSGQGPSTHPRSAVL